MVGKGEKRDEFFFAFCNLKSKKFKKSACFLGKYPIEREAFVKCIERGLSRAISAQDEGCDSSANNTGSDR